MSFVVDVCVVFRTRQGLPSPVRAAAGQRQLVPGEAVEVILRAGVAFEDGDLTERGWFFDTDGQRARGELGRTDRRVARRVAAR